MTERTVSIPTLLLAALASGWMTGLSCAQSRPADEAPDWAAAEAATLAHQTQLTFAEDFVKAGESYFSPDDSRIIFQAVETPPAGQAPEEFYGMFVADVVRDEEGRITGLDRARRVSPKGSANTCGWFHPQDPNVVLFGSTIGPPTESAPPGFQRATGRYRWMFPPEMNVVRCDLSKADGTAAALEVLVQRDAYVAECSLSTDGRFLLYCSLESGGGDLFVLDTVSQRTIRLVGAPGYDGGPFFSPDNKRICYRSDRHGNSLLQLFIADLAYDSGGQIIGIEREYQITDNQNVNWCPFWTRDGRHIVYGTSEVGHHNYEVFLIDADPGNLPGSPGPVKYGTRKRRVTHAAGADILPAFTSDGKTLLWTSQRGEDGKSQLWTASFVMDPDPAPSSTSGYDPSAHQGSE